MAGVFEVVRLPTGSPFPFGAYRVSELFWNPDHRVRRVERALFSHKEDAYEYARRLHSEVLSNA